MAGDDRSTVGLAAAVADAAASSAVDCSRVCAVENATLAVYREQNVIAMTLKICRLEFKLDVVLDHWP